MPLCNPRLGLENLYKREAILIEGERLLRTSTGADTRAEINSQINLILLHSYIFYNLLR